jgi:hypothetical protein
MHRIQVQLTPEQERRLREMAKLRGESISALIREGVAQIIAPEAERREAFRRRALDQIGAFDSGLADVSVEHDRYIAEAAYERLHGK